MKHHHGYAVGALCALAGMLLASSALAADADVTGLVPTVWLDFENQSAAGNYKNENKGSASISFTASGTKTYKEGAAGGYAADTAKYTPYSGDGTFSTVGQPFTISLVMTLGTNPNGITLNVRSNAGDLIIRRGAAVGSLVIGFGPQKSASTNFLNATFLDGDAAYHLVSIVGKSDGMELYIDGTLADSSTKFTPWSASGKVTQVQLGSHLGGTKEGEAAGGGLIDDFRIHTTTLTPSQMKAIAAKYRLVSLVDTLEVSGLPLPLGTVSPSYIITNGISQGDIFQCFAIASETTTAKAIPIGYSLYSVAEDGTEILKEEGVATSFTYTHGTTGAHLVWNWAHSNMVSVAASEGGTATAGDWVGYEETFDVTATPHGGYKFLYWTGDTAGIDVLLPSIVVPAVTKPLSLAAKFIGENVDETIQWVSSDGDDGNDGYDKASPKKTITAAVATLNPVDANKTCTVYIKPGTYTLDLSVAPISLTRAVRIVGIGNTPEDVIVKRTSRASANPSGGRSTQDCSIFHLDNSEALVANLVMHYGSAHQPTSGTTAGSAWIGANGGTISNCVVRGGRADHPYAVTAGILMKGPGLVTHCVITNNVGTYDMEPSWSGDELGSAVVMTGTGGRLENCLIQDNRGTAEGEGNNGQEKMSTICAADSSSIVNCTVISNRARKCAGIYAKGSDVTVKNCVMAGNFDVGITATNPNWMGGGTFVACATDDATRINESCYTGSVAKLFRDYDHGDYRPKASGPLVNKCVSYVGMPAIDLGGNKRLIGSKIDIGCYEANAAEFRIHLR